MMKKKMRGKYMMKNNDPSCNIDRWTPNYLVEGPIYSIYVVICMYCISSLASGANINKA